MAETRVTAGEFRGRVIDTPRGMAVRPTRGMVRESLFNILGGRVENARVVDLFAGAGTLGFEALSRGAARVTFVDTAAAALSAIRSTATRFSCLERCRIIRADARRWVLGNAADVAATDICFVDAPYRDPELDQILEALGTSPPRLVVCEHHERRLIPQRAGALVQVRTVRHGLTTLTMLQPEPEGFAESR